MVKSKNKKKDRRGAATIDYIGLITLVLIALVLFKSYIVRGLSGKWKSSGDSIGLGRQYDPRLYGKDGTGGGTLDCMWDDEVNAWIDRRIAEVDCKCTLPPEDQDYQIKCINCKAALTDPCNSI